MENTPKFYKNLRERFSEYGDVLEELGRISKDNGPVDTKTAHLLKLVAAAAIRSEGAVHSHTRRALEAGATEDEIYHSLIITTSTIGFPTVAAAISWVDDIVYGKKDGKY
ncbi:MAG: carboxymuconolactone decarboxylase family protein [Methanobrevibacter sp.]|jgi:alkylhydroperoxidase/carboxymuconolactone decarboxylase family protein YurZ|nr:carboxymuconolactone decarboxylase family protein [Candidatus Methanovirga aequatorialis]